MDARWSIKRLIERRSDAGSSQHSREASRMTRINFNVAREFSVVDGPSYKALFIAAMYATTKSVTPSPTLKLCGKLGEKWDPTIELDFVNAPTWHGLRSRFLRFEAIAHLDGRGYEIFVTTYDTYDRSGDAIVQPTNLTLRLR
ncbi:MAG TPA: hypothetical protein VFQ70_02565 [Candidatus Saccharimonadaceae bacterium]|nr:hypothetical protein [Candidatus Saccharimonadaceae bacterium]